MFARLRFVSTLALLAGIPLFAAAQTDREWLAEGRSFLQLQKLRDAGCTACHDSTRRIIGPTWQEVAKRYAGNPAAPGLLADRVIKGSSGAWGQVPMPPSLKISRAEAEELLREVLDTGSVAASPATSTVAAGGGRRIALVIGNDAYPNAPLTTPRNDAAGMEHMLGKLGFEVTRQTDLKAGELRFAWRRFYEALPPDSIVLLYFSGHGLRVDGADYLLATDAGIERPLEPKRNWNRDLLKWVEEVGGVARPVDLPQDALGLDEILQNLASRKTLANIILIDTRLDSHFAGKGGAKPGAVPYLASPPPQTLVALAAGAGGVARDDGDKKEGFYSTFTEHLLKVLDSPEVNIELALQRTSKALRAESRNAQTPWWSSSIKDDLVLARTSVPTSGPTGADRLASAPPASATASQPVVAVAPVPAPSPQETLKTIEARAEKGDVSAMKFLSKLYLSGGDGIEKSITKAHVWLIKAAREHEDDEAYFRLGQLYEGGQTVDGQVHIGAARGSYLNAANRGHREARAAYERLTTTAGTAREEAPQQAESSFSFGDFLRGVGKVIGAAGMVAGARYNDPGMIQQGAALIGGDANEIARTQAAQNARQQAARQAQSVGGAGGGDCAQHWNNAQQALRERDNMRSLGRQGPGGTSGQAGAQNDAYNLHMNAYRACTSQ